MWRIPSSVTGPIMEMASHLGSSWVGAVEVIPESAYEENHCHNNVCIHTSIYNGEPIHGYYYVEGYGTTQAIGHTVWKNPEGKLIDVTPYFDKREFNIFSVSKNNQFPSPNFFFGDKYIFQETGLMYYVYQLVDPRTNQPFYIGKGSGNRAQTHLKEIPNTRNVYKENKIANIRSQGLEPRIEYIAENIIDESLAYDIEEQTIIHYGRKGYEENGILTNICLGSRPPNHKGKTYEDIYGVERAHQQRELRTQLQIARGGYGPKKHTIESRKKISDAVSGENNPMFGKKQSETARRRIGESNKKYFGRLNKKSVRYLLENTVTGIKIELYGGELLAYCKENNLCYATFRKNLELGWPPSRKGRNKNWIIKRSSEDVAEIRNH